MRCIGNFSFPQPRTPLPGVQSHSLQNAIVLLPMQSKQLLCQITIYKNRIGDIVWLTLGSGTQKGDRGFVQRHSWGTRIKCPKNGPRVFFRTRPLRSGGSTRHLWDRGPIQCLSRRVAPTWCRRSSIGVHRIQESLSPGMHVIGAHD